MNKRGIELGESVLQSGKLIFAAVIILGIIFAFYKIADYYSTSQDEKNAKKLLDSITGKIDNLEAGESNDFLLQGVEDWYLVGWNKTGERPEKCFFSSCLCICPEGNIDSCQSSGVCSETEFRSISVSSYIAYNFNPVGSFQPGFLYAQCIFLPDNLIDLEIEKGESSLVIYHDYGTYEDRPSGKSADFILSVPDSLKAYCYEYEQDG